MSQERYSSPELRRDNDTFPKLLLRNYKLWADKKIAYRHKDFGYWWEFTWKDSCEAVKYLALGLASLGFERGDRIAICGENSPEWFWGQLSAQSLGGSSVGLYTDCMPSELEYIIDHCDAKIVMADGQEQADKLLTLKDRIPKVTKVIYWKAKGMWAAYDNPWLMAFDKVMDLGRDYEKVHPGFFEESVAKGNGDDIAIILYTSGTTGLPKGALARYRNLFAVFEGIEVTRQWQGNDQILSYLPPAWIAEQGSTVAPNLVKGIPVNFVEGADTVQEDVREIAPQSLFFSPRQWEMYSSIIQARMMDSSWAKRVIYNLFLPVGYKVSDLQVEEERVNLLWRALYGLGHLLLFRPLRDKLGLLKLTWGLSGGAPFSPENFRLLRAIGIPLRQAYGGTEISGVATMHLQMRDVRYESSGAPLPGVVIRINDDGEVLLAGNGLCAGYHKQPEESLRTFAGGYWHTGDAGYMSEEGQLYVFDRVTNMRTLKTGEKFAPAYIETRLKSSQYVREVMSLGGGERDYVACVIDMEYENVGLWAERNRVVFTSYPDLSQKPEVTELICNDVLRLNRSLPENVRIKKFLVLHKGFDPDEAELTRTRKLRRAYIEERYEDLIEGMYAGKDKVDAQSTVTYRDGRQATINVSVTIKTVW